MDQIPDQLQQAGINVDSLRKGDYFNRDQVELAYRLIDDKIEEKLERYQRGDLKADPMTWACQKVIEHVSKLRAESGRPVVCRCQDGGVRVLTDAEAASYLNAQANAGLKKHEKKTDQLVHWVDMTNLNDHQKRQLEADQRRHTFVLAAHKGARTQSLRMQRRGLQLPNFTQDLGDKTRK